MDARCASRMCLRVSLGSRVDGETSQPASSACMEASFRAARTVEGSQLEAPVVLRPGSCGTPLAIDPETAELQGRKH
jgi:hypothetical protein